ncbi:hypothetical protein MMC21_000782 [Puttea exsequens]|nr:hypothetical protein [Puttea exsequens]
MPHGPETFLPPLLDPETGEEAAFLYEPYLQSARDPNTRLSIPTYGSWEITDLLVKQYPPLFHAAANVPSFMRAMATMPNLEHLKVSCPGQEPSQRYRRSIVDYALISLRIAVEKSKLLALECLSLLSVHPSAVFYLNPLTGFGATPASMRRWKQIQKFDCEMDSIALGYPIDHLKHLHAYLQNFASTAREFRFRWLGTKGPCPLSLGAEACLEASSPKQACPKTCHLALRPLQFTRLRVMEVENTILSASQIAAFITANRHTLRDFNFENTHLRSGTWDEALAPLTRISGSEKWKQKSEEVMDVPIMLSPIDMEQESLNRVWDEHVRSRREKSLQGALHRAGAKGRELLFGTEEHWRKFLGGWNWR